MSFSLGPITVRPRFHHDRLYLRFGAFGRSHEVRVSLHHPRFESKVGVSPFYVRIRGEFDYATKTLTISGKVRTGHKRFRKSKKVKL